MIYIRRNRYEKKNIQGESILKLFELDVALVLAICLTLLLLTACASINDGVPQSRSMSVSQSYENISNLEEKEYLANELEKRGFGKYAINSMSLYTGNFNGCQSLEKEVDRSQLLIYSVINEDNIVAISKADKTIFKMSQVDGILYDIKDNPGYVHDDEYKEQEAELALKNFLKENTDIDPDLYDIIPGFQYIDDGYNYHFRFRDKSRGIEAKDIYQFYVSKKLDIIAEITYVSGPVEKLIHVNEMDLHSRWGADGKTFSIDEVKEILLKALDRNGATGNFKIEQNVVTVMLDFYEYRLCFNDGSCEVYRISPDLTYADQFDISYENSEIPTFTYLKGSPKS